MRATRGFPADVLAAIRNGKMLSIRAGTQPHRFIGIWVVVVQGRVYLEKYTTPGSIKYARDTGRAKSRATTTELVPL